MESACQTSPPLGDVTVSCDTGLMTDEEVTVKVELLESQLFVPDWQIWIEYWPPGIVCRMPAMPVA